MYLIVSSILKKKSKGVKVLISSLKIFNTCVFPTFFTLITQQDACVYFCWVRELSIPEGPYSVLFRYALF